MKSRFLRGMLALLLIACIVYSVSRIMDITNEYDKAETMQNDMMPYRPPDPPQRPPETAAPAVPSETPSRTPIVNQSIIDAQREVNGDIVGWLTVPGTKIDYLFVQALDNDFYLYRDLNKNHATAGSIFMDFRNSADFADFNTILYGHHMKNGSMFQNLQKFQEDVFFTQWRSGTIYLATRTFTLEIFAYLVVQSDNDMIYTTRPESLESYLAYVRREARQYRDAGLNETDRVVTLSTCGYEYEGARIVLLAKLTEN